VKVDAPQSIAAGLDPAATSGTPTAASSQQEFLQLLVAQLENQNPLEPQSGAEFVAQLAQFAALEQVALTNDKLGVIQTEQAAAADASLASFVGREATAIADTIAIDDPGAVPPMAVELDDAIKSGSVVIKDANGDVVRELPLGASAAGEIPITWDGKDAKGVAVEEGSYSIEIEATATEGTPVDARARLTGAITALEFINGQPRLRVGGAHIPPGSILSIR